MVKKWRQLDERENMRTRKEPLSQSGKENLHLPTTEESLYVLSATILLIITKRVNMKRHHETRHSNFSNNYPLKSALRRSKLTELKSLLNSQQTLIKTFNNEGDTTNYIMDYYIMTSLYHDFIISWNIARAKHSYSDGEFVKKNIAEDIAVLDPTNRKSQRLASQTPVSRHTVRKEDLLDQC